MQTELAPNFLTLVSQYSHQMVSFQLNSSMAITVLLIILSILAVGSVARNRRRKKYHPVASTVFHQLLHFNRLHDFWTECAQKHATFQIFSPFRNDVFTSDPVNVEYILKTNFDNYPKGPNNHEILKDLLGDGIFNVDGDKWREQRKMFSHEFSIRLLKDYSSSVFRTNAIKLANIVAECAISNQPMDIQELFMKSTVDSIFQIAFGVELDSLCGAEEGTKFCKAFDDMSAMTIRRYVDMSWKVKQALNIGYEAKVKENGKVMDEFIYKLIRIKKEHMRTSIDGKEDVASRFLKTEADPKYLRDVILNFVMAGKDTTATTLSWFIYMLCKHQIIQERIAQEVKEVTQITEGSNSIPEFAALLNEAALEQMHYLHAALTETLRLYPPVPVNPKKCMSDDIFPDGFHVKKGMTIAYLPYAMGRMKFLWGDDAEIFKPERWLDQNGNFRPESPFKFTAFQAGPRICLGKDFSYKQMKILTAVLLRSFFFRLTDENRAVKYRTMINLHIDGGLSVRALPRFY